MSSPSRKPKPRKAWAGRFAQDESPLMERFNASLPVDRRLYEQDIDGSLAHANMLKNCKLLTDRECRDLCAGLETVRSEIRAGDFIFDDAQEDIHMAIEARLRDLVGPAAGKLHTARSRNDQVATDFKLFVRSTTQTVIKKIRVVQKAFMSLADKNPKVVMPGYTHLQRAQPVLFAHHLLAYFEMFDRDVSRFSDNLSRLNECPLGAGALAGTTLGIDRQQTAKSLGFATPTRNSLDTVADRDFALDFLFAASALMTHISRFAEELVLWSSQEFNFVRLPEGFCTGSSMMPQKVNPDAAELLRGKTGRVYGDLITLLTVMKGLPLAYNKDMQEDKAPVIDAADTIAICLDVLSELVPGLIINSDAMTKALDRGHVLATDLADFLATRGVPFRDAHEIVGKLVQEAEKRQCALSDFTSQELKKYHFALNDDVREVLSLTRAVAKRTSFGGTAPQEVRKQMTRAKAILKKAKA